MMTTYLLLSKKLTRASRSAEGDSKDKKGTVVEEELRPHQALHMGEARPGHQTWRKLTDVDGRQVCPSPCWRLKGQSTSVCGRCTTNSRLACRVSDLGRSVVAVVRARRGIPAQQDTPGHRRRSRRSDSAGRTRWTLGHGGRLRTSRARGLSPAPCRFHHSMCGHGLRRRVAPARASVSPRRKYWVVWTPK